MKYKIAQVSEKVLLLIITLIFLQINLYAQKKTFNIEELQLQRTFDASVLEILPLNDNFIVNSIFTGIIKFVSNGEQVELTSYGGADVLILKINSLGKIINYMHLGTFINDYNIKIYIIKDEFDSNLFLSLTTDLSIDLDPSENKAISFLDYSSQLIIARYTTNFEYLDFKSFQSTGPYKISSSSTAIFDNDFYFTINSDIDSLYHEGFWIKDNAASNNRLLSFNYINGLSGDNYIYKTLQNEVKRIHGGNKLYYESSKYSENQDTLVIGEFTHDLELIPKTKILTYDNIYLYNFLENETGFTVAVSYSGDQYDEEGNKILDNKGYGNIAIVEFDTTSSNPGYITNVYDFPSKESTSISSFSQNDSLYFLSGWYKGDLNFSSIDTTFTNWGTYVPYLVYLDKKSFKASFAQSSNSRGAGSSSIANFNSNGDVLWGISYSNVFGNIAGERFLNGVGIGLVLNGNSYPVFDLDIFNRDGIFNKFKHLNTADSSVSLSISNVGFTNLEIDTIRTSSSLNVTYNFNSIKPDSSKKIDIEFTRRMRGEYIDTLYIHSNDKKNSLSTVLINTYEIGPKLKINYEEEIFNDGEHINLWSVPSGSSITKTIQFINGAEGALQIDSLKLSANDYFSIIKESNLIYNISNISSISGIYYDTLIVYSNEFQESDRSHQSFILEANHYKPTQLSFSSETKLDIIDIDFGAIKISEDSTFNIKIFNNGETNLNVNNLVIASSSSDFLYNLKESNPSSSEIGIIQVTLEPTSLGQLKDTLKIKSEDSPDYISIFSEGIGSGAKIFISDTLFFQPSSLIDSTYLLVRNIGNLNLDIFEANFIEPDLNNKIQFSTIPISPQDTGIVKIVFNNLSNQPNSTTFRIHSSSYIDSVKDVQILLDKSLIVGIDKENSLPNAYELHQNYPNPFNPSTTIKYEIPIASKVRLEIYNMLGQKVAILVNKWQAPGSYSIIFNASSLSSGLYIYKIKANDYSNTKKFSLIK